MLKTTDFFPIMQVWRDCLLQNDKKYCCFIISNMIIRMPESSRIFVFILFIFIF